MSKKMLAHFEKRLIEERNRVLKELRDDARRTIVTPSRVDVDAAGAVFTTVADAFAAQGARQAGLLRAAHEEIASIRAGK